MNRRLRKRLLLAGATGSASLLLFCSATYLSVSASGDDKCFDSVGEVPAHRMAMVLGCPKFLPSGNLSLEYERRVTAAAELFKAGKCERVLVSSDVDAPAMLADVRAAGVPADRLDCDPLGVRTRASVLRAKDVFGITSGIVVSQRYHNERSIYIGEEIGAAWVGFDAQDAVGLPKWRSRGREVLARTKAWLDRHVLDRR